MGPMIIGDNDSATVVTPKIVQATKKDGTLVTKIVWESLHASTERTDSYLKVAENYEPPSFEYEPVDNTTPPPDSSTYQVRMFIGYALMPLINALKDATKLYAAVRRSGRCVPRGLVVSRGNAGWIKIMPALL